MVKIISKIMILFKILKKNINKFLLIFSDIIYSPYSLNNKIFKPKEVSDLFIWSNNFKRIYFVAENTNSLLKGCQQDVLHIFKFYSPQGFFIGKYIYETNDFFERIKLPQISNDFDYCSFLHFKQSKKTIKDILREKRIFTKFRAAPQSRGYTIYFTEKNKVGAAVHGNFGGVTFKGDKTAKQRDYFVYTSVYKFERDSLYNLVFNNPTSKVLSIKVIFFDKNQEKIIIIPVMGTKYIEFDNYSGGISFESKLPVCRPLIFKNPPPKSSGFDVFHG